MCTHIYTQRETPKDQKIIQIIQTQHHRMRQCVSRKQWIKKQNITPFVPIYLTHFPF